MSDNPKKTNLPFKNRLFNTKNLKYLAIGLMAGISIAMSCLSEFIKAKITTDIIGSGEWWYKTFESTFRNTMFAIALLWLAMIICDKWLDKLYNALILVWEWIINNGQSLNLDKYFDNVNQNKKINKYKTILQKKLIDRKVTESEKFRYKQISLLNNDEIWNGCKKEIEKKEFIFEGVRFMDIPYIKVTESFIFSGLKSEKNADGDNYTPFISIIKKILPAIISTTIISAALSSVVAEFVGKSPLAYILALINLLTLISTGVAGYSIGEYITNIEKRAFLEYRVSKAYGFKGSEYCPKELLNSAPERPKEIIKGDDIDDTNNISSI